ncbi:hypothetical protein E2C01_009904 [Portunus trituberculatus]|uniref:Uncharacterized protein n=1 Tax=Portunus trituberculatus TaxID=210409 RepID=A0A5B7D6Y6_PORTR|nr:hypothetical protein [Portunus trituberculatus]
MLRVASGLTANFPHLLPLLLPHSLSNSLHLFLFLPSPPTTICSHSSSSSMSTAKCRGDLHCIMACVGPSLDRSCPCECTRLRWLVSWCPVTSAAPDSHTAQVAEAVDVASVVGSQRFITTSPRPFQKHLRVRLDLRLVVLRVRDQDAGR